MAGFTRIITWMTAGLLSFVTVAAETNDVAFVAAYDGSTQRYVLILPDGFNPAQSNDVLVCLHGHGSDRWQYVNAVRGETSSARDVARQYQMIFVSPDYRATTSWMGPAAEADMLQIVGDLKQQYKVRRMIFSGGSMGASSALTFTALHPELVDGVVALNGLANHETYLNFQSYIAASFGGTKAEVPDEYHKRSAVFFPERFTMPLAITAGGLDTTIPPESVMQLAQAVQTNNPHVRIDYQASRGHETDYTASLAAYQFVVGGETTAPVVVASAAVIAHWDFSGNGLNDASGNCHSLTNSGVVISNGAAIFSGSQTAFSTVSKLDLMGNNNLTVEFFMRTSSTNKGMMMVEQTNPYWQNTGAFMVDVNETGTGTVMGGYCALSAGTKLNLDITSASAASDGLWHHVAIVYDKTKTVADRSMLYFDGIAQGTYASWTNDAVATAFCNGTLYIGSRGNSASKFIGELDDVRISNAALATNQFLQARSAGSPPVVAYWRFDAGAGLVDASSNGNSLASSSMVFTNGVARFSGTHTFNTASTLNLTAYTNLTVEFFMRSTAATPAMAMIELTNPFFSNPGAFIVTLNETNAAGQVMGGFCTASGTKLNLDITAANAAADGQWHHVAIVYDKVKTGTDRSMLYLDGIAQGVYSTWTDGSGTTFRNATLYIGSRGNSGMKYIGEMDDLRITGGALQPGQFLKAPSTDLPRVIAYWPFSPKQRLTDAAGNGRTLSNTGVTFADCAAVFSGSHTAFSTQPWTLNLRPYSALTVEYFVRTTATNVMEALEHSSNFTTARGGFVSVLNEVNRGQIESGFSMPGTSSYNIDSTSAGAVSDGTWHHVALVYDPARSGEDRVRFYLDRVQQGKRTAAWNSDADTFFLNDVLYIGSRANSGSKFFGQLDDIKVTGAALSPSEFLTRRTIDQGTLTSVK
jgi:predicted esterase